VVDFKVRYTKKGKGNMTVFVKTIIGTLSPSMICNAESAVRNFYHLNPNVIVSENREKMTMEMSRHSHIPADVVAAGIKLAISNERYKCGECPRMKKRKCKHHK
jgi:hypothetical protein